MLSLAERLSSKFHICPRSFASRPIIKSSDNLSAADIISRHTVSWKNWTKDHRIKDQGSVQNESNKLNKLIGMIDCSSTWLSQDLPYAKTKIRENTKYWKSHTTLWKCQFSPTDYELILNPWSLILDPWSGNPWSSIFRKPPTNWPSEGVYLLIDYSPGKGGGWGILAVLQWNFPHPL